ncbi:MAG: divergent polysaccharide deacetylase family protein [Alphaproteobacteria bacterium]|nr:divergent polysaccharide deacetylase family protein [Alphaproteobacteria bacterium]
MKIKKLTIFVFFLLAIAVAEGVVVAYDLLHPDKDVFELDYQEYDIPVRKVDVKPFLFETGAAAEAEAILDNVTAEVQNNLMRRIYTSEPATEQPAAVEVDEFLGFSTDELPAEPSVQPQSAKDANVAAENQNNVSRIAVVIDDIGLSEPFVKELEAFNKPITAAFLPYGVSNREQAERLKNAGHGIMVHIPMMPHVPADLAPVTLSPEMDKAETQNKLSAMLDRFGDVGMVGINNHMGSLLTERAKNMEYVMEILKQRGLFFLDSKTTGHSICKESAEQLGVPYIERNVFLDNENDYDYIIGQLHQAERIASKQGFSVAIGHPKAQTLKAIKDWAEDVENRGFKLVLVSELIKK